MAVTYSVSGFGALPRQTEATDAERSPFRKLNVFARALSLIETHYIRSIDDEALIHGAIDGMTQTLDPHSTFWAPTEAKLFRQEIEGRFGGIGVAIRWRSGLSAPQVATQTPEPDASRDENTRLCTVGSGPYLEITRVVAESPAARGKLQVGDSIVAIDGDPLGLFTGIETLTRVRGPVGTPVTLTVRDSAGKSREVRLIRAAVVDDPVQKQALGQGLVLIKLQDFSEGAAARVHEALTQEAAGRDGLRATILDLRGNGGGLLREAVDLVDLFVRSGPIVRTRARNQKIMEAYDAHRGERWEQLPLVVLVDESSASASEIVAGALQDHRRALVIGQRTYGKGSVQVPFDLGDGSTLKLTVALYYTPNDRLIQASGIEPDIVADRKSPKKEPHTAVIDDDAHREEDEPRHLQPQDFGREEPPKSPAMVARTFADDDMALGLAIDHLVAWLMLDPRQKPLTPAKRSEDREAGRKNKAKRP
jgi:carboxyl-terminal processing protease